jgi:hypothetical protein
MCGTSTRRLRIFVALLVPACSSSNALSPECPITGQQPLLNGVSHENYLGLAQSQISAIVQVVSAGQQNGPLCSGTFIAPNWIITAGHCLKISSPRVVVQGEASAPLAVFPVVTSVAHPSVDVALLNVDASASDAGGDGGLPGVVQLQTAGASAPPLASGDVVAIAGYGVTENSTTRSLRFLAESILSIDAKAITVSGFGKSGACEGDSGGPLLIRGSDGAPLLAGVMSVGSASCLEDDTYIRLDALQDWVSATVGPSAPIDTECGTITPQGRCFYGNAVWCEGAQVNADRCVAPKRCGWDWSQNGFRCVDPSADPCDGVDSVGACVGESALWCYNGTLDRQSCRPCDVCRVEGATGRPVCTVGPRD